MGGWRWVTVNADALLASRRIENIINIVDLIDIFFHHAEKDSNSFQTSRKPPPRKYKLGISLIEPLNG